jgi:hypothetical protein
VFRAGSDSLLSFYDRIAESRRYRTATIVVGGFLGIVVVLILLGVVLGLAARLIAIGWRLVGP